MSLLRLLSAGKSWVGSNDSAARYRMGDPRAMPRFGSAKNPFARKQPPAATPSAAPEPERQPVSAAAAKPKPARASKAAKSGSLLSVWKSKWLGWLGKPKSQPLIPPFSKRPVQGELSLDAVRVVRNDLSDTDLEIVTAKARPAAVEAEPSSPVERRGTAEVTDKPGLAGKDAGAPRVCGCG